MEYPKWFKHRCRMVYPDWDNLHSHLEKGGYIVGRLLQDNIPCLDGDQLLAWLNRGRTDLVGQALNDYVAKKKLYAEWNDLAEKQGI